MSSSAPSRPVIALVGAGHAHLHVAARAEGFAAAGFDLVLIDPGLFWYSSLATGLLGGHVAPAEDSLDPAPLIESRGGRFLRERVIGIDTRARRLAFESGGGLDYDILSLNLGSSVSRDLIAPQANACWNRTIWGAKPIPKLLELRRALEAMWEADAQAVPRAIVIGLGVGGTELALNLAALGKTRGRAIDITVLGEASLGERAMCPFLRLLAEKGIAVKRARVAALDNGCAVLEGGETLAFDHAVIATGLQPNELVHEIGLPADAAGLRVTPALHSPEDGRVFAAGDCASIIGHPRPKVGVFGVHAAPILADNLLSLGKALKHGSRPTLRDYAPQKRWLWVLDCGDGTGLGAWGGEIGTAPGAWAGLGLVWHGRSALALKHGIDRRFMARYRVDEAEPPPHET